MQSELTVRPGPTVRESVKPACTSSVVTGAHISSSAGTGCDSCKNSPADLPSYPCQSSGPA